MAKKLNWVEHAQKLIRPWGIPYKDLTNQRAGNSGNLAEHELKFNQASGSPLGVHPPSSRSIRPAICREVHENCATNQRQTNSGNTVEHRSSLNSSLMTSSPTNFEVILISYSSTMHGNCSTHQRPGSGKNSAESDHPTPPEWVHPPIFRSIQSAIYQKMCRNLKSVADEVMHGQGQMIWYL